MTDRTVAHINLVAIALTIDSKQALFVLVARDGLFNRMGSDTLETADGQLFISRSRPPLLFRVFSNLRENMLGSMGGYEIRQQAWPALHTVDCAWFCWRIFYIDAEMIRDAIKRRSCFNVVHLAMMGNQVSDRQWGDLLGVLKVQGNGPGSRAPRTMGTVA
jgi:hypothetical protein